VENTQFDLTLETKTARAENFVSWRYLFECLEGGKWRQERIN